MLARRRGNPARAGRAVPRTDADWFREREHLSRADINPDHHILDVLNVCRFADVARPLLVGHSYGALVATGVADQLQGEVSGLVVIDGFIVDSGQSAFDAYPQVRGLLGSCITPANPNFIQPLPIAAFDVPDGPLTNELARKLRPMPVATHTTPLISPRPCCVRCLARISAAPTSRYLPRPRPVPSLKAGRSRKSTPATWLS